MIRDELTEQLKKYCDGKSNTEKAEISVLNLNRIIKALEQEPKPGYISIDDVMAVFDDFMRGDADENDTETFLEMLKDKTEGSDKK